MVLDSERLHNSTMATAAVAKFQVYYKKLNFLQLMSNVSESVHILLWYSI